MTLSDAVETHIANAHEPTDERGLLPLEKARERVAAASEFRKGEAEMVAGTAVLESDRLWAALLSLEDAAEFVREASRLTWLFHPRGAQEDTSLLDRYGEGVLPWLLSRIGDDGRMLDIPMCVQPCLFAIGTQEVFDALWTVKTVVNGVGTEFPGPFAADNPGDADKREGVNLDGPVPDEPDNSANGIIVSLAQVQPVLAYGAMAKLAAAGDERAKFILYRLAVGAPRKIFGFAAEALGEAEARAAFEAAEIPTELIAVCVLQEVYVWTLDGPWPVFVSPSGRPFHALRVLAFRDPDSDEWLALFERLEHDDEDDVCVHQYVMHSAQGRGEFQLWPDFVVDGTTATGPAGDVTVPEGAPIGDAIRAYLEAHPKAFWTSLEPIMDKFGVDGWEVVVDSDRFQHLLGTAAPPVDSDYDEAWRTTPEPSDTMQSLCRAIARRDPAQFEPGEPNTDWRLHADKKLAEG